MRTNGIMMQYFEWYLPNDGQLWNKLKDDAEHLKSIGVTAVWIPPCYKGTNNNDVGYGAYDLYDLGEFDQKGSVRTKYGTKKELLDCIATLHDNGIAVYADVVLNHKAGGDETQRFMAIEVDPNNRNKGISDAYEIEGWTRFTFPGRNGKYSQFQWSCEHFSGTDFNNANGKSAIYVILGDNKGIDPNDNSVSQEFGNFDYLMFTDVDYKHPDVCEETKRWVSWFIKETGIDGIRIDAIKHINDWFVRDLVNHIHAEFGPDFYIVGEYWYYDRMAIDEYLREVEFKIDLFDVALHFNMKMASDNGQGYDMRNIFTNSVLAEFPQDVVTFVDNHDSQPNQSLASYVQGWFKPLAYALILLRKDGYPCIFYGDYYGIGGEHPIEGMKWIIDQLLDVRRDFAYGKQDDYFDHEHVVGWVRHGDEHHPDGCVVIMSNQIGGRKTMFVGEDYAGSVWYDKLGHVDCEVTIDENGNGVFHVADGSLSVYLKKV
ncbi:alpha-amylase [Porphyromonas pogonae]|uniref:alpha-amylase n=2 Tax=Porphyromonas pogonae TaxID=867595 RepID=UPI00300F7159